MYSTSSIVYKSLRSTSEIVTLAGAVKLSKHLYLAFRLPPLQLQLQKHGSCQPIHDYWLTRPFFTMTCRSVKRGSENLRSPQDHTCTHVGLHVVHQH